MLLYGDELRRTQSGNNNAYCQDNENGWLDWTKLQQHQEIYRFAQGMIALRSAHPVLSREEFYTDSDVQWRSCLGGLPDWGNQVVKQLGCLINEDGKDKLFLLFNASNQRADYTLPALPEGYGWHFAVDTSNQAPNDLFACGDEQLCKDSRIYQLSPRSSALLLSFRLNAARESA